VKDLHCLILQNTGKIQRFWFYNALERFM
jgi:hypothetical protein